MKNEFGRTPGVWCITAAFLLLAMGAAIPPVLNAAASPVQEKSAEIGSESHSSDAVENSVVQVFATLRVPNLARPWSKQSGREVTGSGVVIEGIIVHEPFQSDPGYPLKKWDVITEIGDAAIDNQGNIL